jgi:hypothetical protein
MKRLLSTCLVFVVLYTLVGCGNNNEENKSLDTGADFTSGIQVSSAKNESSPLTGMALVACGEEYKGGDLSFNVYDVQVREDGSVKHLVLNLEVYNNSDKDIPFSPFMTLELVDSDGEECSWNMMIGKLDGIITPKNKIKGDVAFEITENQSQEYILKIGEDYECSEAIKITSSDIGKTYPEIFESSGVISDYTIGVPVQSDVFDIEITQVERIESDKEGKEIILITLSMTNNDSEERGLSFELAGVYTSEGEELDIAANEWTFTNWPIASQATETGIISYYIPEGMKDFYMTVRPNVSEYNNTSNIVFSVE